MEKINHATFVLSDSESISVPARNTIRTSIVCCGALDINNLRSAWQLICSEVQCLAGEIKFSSEHNKYIFQHNQSKGGKVKLANLNNNNLDGYRLLDKEEAVSILEISYESSNKYRISLLIRHAVGDGQFCVSVMSRLWDFYFKLCHNEQIELTTINCPKSLEDLLNTHTYQHGIHRKINLNNQAIYFSPEKWNGSFISELTHSYVLFNEEMTNRLYLKCKKDGITIHGAIAACLALSQHMHKKDISAFYINTIIDLRRWFSPKISSLTGGNILGYSVSEIDFRNNTNFINIATLIMKNLQKDIRSGAANESGIVSKNFNNKSIVPTLLSNVGVIPKFKHTDNLYFNDFTIWNEMDISSAGGPSLLAAYGNTVVSYIFDGRLRFDLFYGKEMFPEQWVIEQAITMKKILENYVYNR